MNPFDKKILSVIYFLLPIFLFSINLHAQIKGNIIDKSSNHPIPNASVYVNNSTYGCKTNDNGDFELKNYPAPPFQLVVSSVGYQSATYNIKNDSTSGELKIALKPKIQDLNEVVILSPEKDGWDKYGKEFIKDFIGYSEFANECDILNKEVIEFRYDRASNTLFVSAQQPLKIKNKATGYIITYWLEDFEKDYSSHKIFFKGYTQFDTLPSIKKKIIERWKTNREKAYSGSLMHFMRSVYNNTVYQDSFEIRVLKRVKQKEYGSYVPVKTDTVTQLTDSFVTNLTINYLDLDSTEIPIWNTLLLKWKNDNRALMSVTINGKQQTDSAILRHLVFKKNQQNHQETWIQYYDVNNRPVDTFAEYIKKKKLQFLGSDSNFKMPSTEDNLIQILYREKMPLDSFVTRNLAGAGVVMKFKDFLEISYVKELEEPAYLENLPRELKHKAEAQRSVISIKNPIGIFILPDGNFYNPYNLFLEQYWEYEKIDKILPLDYEP